MTFLITAHTHTKTQSKFIPFCYFHLIFAGKARFFYLFACFCLSHPREANWLDDDDASCFIFFLVFFSWFLVAVCLRGLKDRNVPRKCWRFGWERERKGERSFPPLHGDGFSWLMQRYLWKWNVRLPGASAGERIWIIETKGEYFFLWRRALKIVSLFWWISFGCVLFLLSTR